MESCPSRFLQEDFGKEGTLPLHWRCAKDDEGNVSERKYKMNTLIVRRVLAPGEVKKPLRRVKTGTGPPASSPQGLYEVNSSLFGFLPLFSRHLHLLFSPFAFSASVSSGNMGSASTSSAIASTLGNFPGLCPWKNTGCKVQRDAGQATSSLIFSLAEKLTQFLRGGEPGSRIDENVKCVERFVAAGCGRNYLSTSIPLC